MTDALAKPKDAHVWTRAEFDFYTEPRWTVDLLIDAEKYQGRVWDPCCGHRTIARAFEARNYPIISSDLVDHPDAIQGDFLLHEFDEPEVDHIVCNPPYTLTIEFIREALRRVRKTAAFLVPMKWLASQTRYDLFQEIGAPARIHILSNRPSMPPGQYLDPETGLFNCDDPDPKRDKKTGELKHRWFKGDEPKGGAIDYCWVVFVPGYGGPTRTTWLSRGGGKGQALYSANARQGRRNGRGEAF